MRAAILVPLALILSTASAEVAPAKTPDRRVVLASNAARAVITESKIDDTFFYERCYLPNAPAKTITQELADADYKDCVAITRPIADNDANRGEFNRQFAESINDLFKRHRQFQAVGRVAAVSTVAAVIGGTLPLFHIPRLAWMHTQSIPRLIAYALGTGVTVGGVYGYYVADHLDEYGLSPDVKDALDSDLGSDLILLDRTTRKPRAASQAFEVFEHALGEATAATLATS